MKFLCKLGLHKWKCEWPQTHGKFILQFFRCSRCAERHRYCGFIDISWMDEITTERLKVLSKDPEKYYESGH